MDLNAVMRTMSAVREFTDDPLPDSVLYRVIDSARFAPSGGNRQGTHVTVVRDATVRQRLAALNVPGAQRYFAQLAAGEGPWNPVVRAVCPAKPSRPQRFPMNSPCPFAERRSYW